MYIQTISQGVKMAKISKLFRLSEDAIAILNTKPNASRFVEDLILKGGEGISRGESMILDLMQNMVDLNTVQTKLLTTPPITNERYARQGDPRKNEPPVVELGFACCKLKTPCKHWAYSVTSMGWENSLTGEFKEA